MTEWMFNCFSVKSSHVLSEYYLQQTTDQSIQWAHVGPVYMNGYGIGFPGVLVFLKSFLNAPLDGETLFPKIPMWTVP